MTVTADVLIIGGGMAGASCGYFLAGQADTILLEAESQPGYHTTGRSAALFFQNYGNATIRRITRASRPFLAEPPEGFAEVPLMTPRGALLLATEALATELDRQLADQPDTEILEGEALFELAPYLKRDVVVRAGHEADAMDMDVNAILQGFLRSMKAAGGRVVVDAEVVALSRTGSVWRAETRAGTFEAPVVVNAAGAWCDAVAALAGIAPVGLVPKRRTAFTFDVAPGDDPHSWPMAVLCDESWYVRPESGRMMGSPADENPSPPCDAQPDELDLAIAVDRIQNHTNFKIDRLVSRWAGLRSFVADKSPVVGFDPATEGFLWLAGQGGYGIQTAPGLGRLSAALASGQPMPEDLQALGLSLRDLAPDRPGLDRSA